MTTYPKVIRLENDKLKSLIQEKEAQILAGRRISQEIDLINEAQEVVNKNLVEAEQAVDVSVLQASFNEKKKAIIAAYHEAAEIERQVLDLIRANTPQELRDQYDELEKQKEEKESQLNKLGHKVQKIKDKIIPLVQKIGKPYLEDEFDDFNTTKLGEDGTPIIEIYNELEDFKRVYRSKNNK